MAVFAIWMRVDMTPCCGVQVKTDMTGGLGDIDIETSTHGMLSVLESGVPLQARFYSYSGQELPW